MSVFITPFFLPELASDGKIYYNSIYNTLAYHVINRPELPLEASDMAQRGQVIPRWLDGTRCHFPNYRLGRWSGSPCDTLSFKAPSDAEFQHVPWSESGARQEGVATVKALKWPPGITAPDTNPPPGVRVEGIKPHQIFRTRLQDSTERPKGVSNGKYEKE